MWDRIGELHGRSEPFRELSEPYVGSMFLRRQMTLPEPSKTFRREDLLARTEEFNRASERYYVEHKDKPLMMNKPFSENYGFAKRLFDLGVLVQWLRISPGDAVAEIGAGTCWISWFLNRYGCRTISVDISQTALEMGRQVFQRDPLTNWSLEPQFLSYDGHRLPLSDSSCDKILVHDSFHHFPNQEELLGEMYRVLKPGGCVGMREPGRTHANTDESKMEMENTGILENDVVLEELEELAKHAGFTEVTLVPVNLDETIEIPASRLGDFMKGKALRHYWTKLCQGIQTEHFILFYKGRYLPTTRKPRTLRARIDMGDKDEIVTEARGGSRLKCRVRNEGDTLWLAAPPWSGGVHRRLGWTRLGAHLYDAEGELQSYDWYRADLPCDVPPGETVDMELQLPPLAEAGRYRVELDLLIEGMTWFSDRGSPVKPLKVVVER